MNKSCLFDLGFSLYSAFVTEKADVYVPAEYVDIVKRVCSRVGWNTVVHGQAVDFDVAVAGDNKKVLLGLSGGLDSVYLLFRLIEQGYEPTAVHVRGLNRSAAAEEAKRAKAAAKLAGARFVEALFKPPAQAFPDNPFKNQLILSIMLDIGVKEGVYRYALGSDWTTPLEEGVVGYTITDTNEVNDSFWQGVQKHFPQAKLIFIDDAEKKYSRLDWLYKNHPEALDKVSSCIAPLRFRETWHKRNEEKYGIQLMDGRCGSCYKCAMEYIMLVEAGHLQKNEAFYRHCWKTLATSKTAHRPDLFAEELPQAERMKNLLNYGS